MRAPAAADMEPELAGERLQPPLQRTQHARGDARGVPVHAHDGAERLEPERMGEPAQELVPAIVVHDRLRHDRTQPRHALPEPGRHPAMVKGQIGAAARRAKGIPLERRANDPLPCRG